MTPRTPRLAFGCLAAALAVLCPGAARESLAQSAVDAQRAAGVKAAYLRYIAEFTIWPDGVFSAPDAPVVIGSVGEDAAGVVAALEVAIARKGLRAQQRALVVRRLDAPTPDADPRTRREFADSLAGCNVLFLPSSQREHWPRIRALLAKRAVVTVGDFTGFSTSQGMIEFVIDPEEGRVSIHIDLEAVESAQLRLSSRLLGLKKGVKIVKQPPDEVGGRATGAASRVLAAARTCAPQREGALRRCVPTV